MNRNTKNRQNDSKIDVSKTTCIENSISMITEIANLIETSSKYTPLNRIDFNINILDSWTEVRTKSQPKRRSYHSTFIYKDYLYIIGGLDIITGKLNDIKRLKLLGDIFKWEEVNPTGSTLGKYCAIIFLKNFSLNLVKWFYS